MLNSPTSPNLQTCRSNGLVAHQPLSLGSPQTPRIQVPGILRTQSPRVETVGGTLRAEDGTMVGAPMQLLPATTCMSALSAQTQSMSQVNAIPRVKGRKLCPSLRWES
jgi:hypothetical protein